MARRSRKGRAAWILAPLALAACQVEWGGGGITLEDPAPPADTSATADAVPDVARRLPLPDGPLLYLARIAPDAGARLAPVARLGGDPPGASLSGLAIPDSADDGYRARFDSTFLAPGSELELFVRGTRIGTVALTGEPRAVDSSCPSVTTGRVLVLPGQPPPSWALARPRLDGATPPDPAPALQPTRSMRVAAPVLAERMIADGRAYLAQRMDLEAVELPGDTLPGMAATYLIADSLAPGPPAGDAVSLFFLARFEPARGFIPVWQEVRRYASAEAKEAFEYLDWIPLPAGRLDLVRRYDGTAARVAASLLPEGAPREAERQLTWSEPAACSVLASLEAAGP